jgi:hypothetical protein
MYRLHNIKQSPKAQGLNKVIGIDDILPHFLNLNNKPSNNNQRLTIISTKQNKNIACFNQFINKYS